MTYFKTSRRPHIDIDVLDPRRIEAAIEPPRWWHELAELVDRHAPALDLGALCLGPGPAARQHNGFVLTIADADSSEIVQLYGITGLATGRSLEIELPQPAGVVDVGIAHFGEPPSLVALANGNEVTTATADPRQRHIENLRLVGSGIDRLVITSGSEASLNYIRTQPQPARRVRKRG